MAEQGSDHEPVSGGSTPSSPAHEMVHVPRGSLLRIVRDEVVISFAAPIETPKDTVLTTLQSFYMRKGLRGCERGMVHSLPVFWEGQSVLAHLFEDEFEVM